MKSVRGSKPNIIFVLCDDLGFGDLGCYGSTRSNTPVLDRLAKQGIKLNDFHVSSPVCSPSRASIMTGCYSQRIGLGKGENFVVLLPGDSIGISSEEETIPQVLKRAGYSTKMIGKWHLGDQPEFLPTRHGFDEYFGLPYSNDMCYFHPFLEMMFPPLPLMREDQVVETDPRQGFLNERYIDEATQYIEKHSHEPFFLYLAHMVVHWPFYPPHAFLHQADGDKYRAEIEYLDWGMKQIVQTLERQNLRDNTLIVFTSDNGGVLQFGSNGSLRGQKGDVYEGGMRVPCIVNWPSAIRGENDRSSMMTTMDLLPTFAALAGVELHPGRLIDGEDYSEILFGDQMIQMDRRMCYYHNNVLKAVRRGPWKLILATNELFHLMDDVSESVNRYGEFPEIVDQLLSLAEAYRDELGDGDRIGKGVRPPGRVDYPKTLIALEPNSPWTAEYE